MSYLIKMGKVMRQSGKGNPFLIAMIVIMLFLAIGCGKQEEVETAPPPTIDFIKYYDVALETAREKSMPVLLDFYTDWCGWCKRLDSITFRDSAVAALSEKIIFAKINGGQDTVAREKHSIQGYPSLVLLDSAGQEIDRIGGFLPPDEFVITINNYLQGIGTLDYYLAIADTGSTPEIDFALAQKYGDRGLFDKSEEYFQKVIKTNKNNEGSFTSASMMALADISLRLDRYDEAIARYNMVKKKFPDSTTVNDADIYIAICHREKGDTTAAIKAFEDFLINYPNSPDSSYAQKQIDRLKNPPPPEEEE